jgi:hypothetical protein
VSQPNPVPFYLLQFNSIKEGKIMGGVQMDGYTEDDAILAVGSGWTPIIIELYRELKEKFPAIKVVQVKEKFGLLRIYIEGENALEAYNLVNEAEMRSRAICENCGSPGSFTIDPRWIKTLCTSCKQAQGRK